MIGYSAIISGLLGTLLVILVTLILFWYSHHIRSKSTLINRLEFIRQDVYNDKVKAAEIWETSLPEIEQLYKSHYLFAVPWQCCRIKRAWEQYRGIKKEAEKKAKAQGITYISKTPLYDTDDLFHRINTFLKVL